MGGRCTSFVDGCSCSSCSSSSPATISVNAQVSPAYRSSQKSRAAVNEKEKTNPKSPRSIPNSRSPRSSPNAGEDVASAPHLEQFSVAGVRPDQGDLVPRKVRRGSRHDVTNVSDQCEVSEGSSPEKKCVNAYQGDSAPRKVRRGSHQDVTNVSDQCDDIEGSSPEKKGVRQDQGDSAIVSETEGLSMQNGLQDSLNRSSPTSSVPNAEISDLASDGGGSQREEESWLRSAIPSFAVGVTKELKTFRQFLKPRHSTVDEAYESLLGYALVLDEKRFMDRMEELGYMGNSQRLFYALATDGSGTITRKAMKEHLVAAAKIPAPKKKAISFGVVSLHDPTPLDHDTIYIPPTEILVEDAEEAKESRPKASYKEESMNLVEIRRTQPGASGQPASGS